MKIGIVGPDSGGMSVSLLEKKMIAYIREEDLSVYITVYPQCEMEHYIDSIDVALVLPQIAFSLQTVKSVYEPKGIPVGIINTSHYASMNSEKILEYAYELDNMCERDE
ncbi:PTS sugar transporter subunit IIB [Priestia megaterium]|uniref:PTS sugar transporter subunit IIB n=1 Tax=Priestia megaterium TaxID=1404 RepID=UPI002674BDD1|nr:PTS sugar transporter subunit IIB [Priestia megaterium]WKU22091.1 PTS sugar transporter subunit IIB [Priestia megaterium]